MPPRTTATTASPIDTFRDTWERRSMFITYVLARGEYSINRDALVAARLLGLRTP